MSRRKAGHFLKTPTLSGYGAVFVSAGGWGRCRGGSVTVHGARVYATVITEST
jgi:hypothetical protein